MAWLLNSASKHHSASSPPEAHSDEYLNYLVLDQPAMHLNYGGPSVRGTQAWHHTMGDYGTTDASNCLLQSADKQKTVMEGGSTGLSPNGFNNNEAPIMHTTTEFVANNQPQSMYPPSCKAISQNHTPGSHQGNMTPPMANSQPRLDAMNQYSPSLSKQPDQSQSLGPPLNNAISDQQYTVVASLPTDFPVVSSQQRDPENTHSIPNIPNFLGSVDKPVQQTGTVPQLDREMGVNVTLGLNANQIPSGDMYQLEVTMHPFVVEVSRKMPFESLRREILKKSAAQLETVSITSNADGTQKATIGTERKTQTVSSESDRKYTLKRKIVRLEATESDSSHDSKSNCVEETHRTTGMSRGTIKNSANAPADEIPIVRSTSLKKTARGSTKKSTCAASPPRVEAQNLDCSQQISEASKCPKPKFSEDEIRKLIDAVGKHGVGKWNQIQQDFFSGSGLTANDLKGKWRSLVLTAQKPPERRRSSVSGDQLERVKELQKAYKK